MKEKEILRKWLDHEELTPQELETLNNSDDFDSYRKLTKTAKKFKAPAYEINANWDHLHNEVKKRKPLKKTRKSYFGVIARIAAIFVIGVGVYFTFFKDQKPTVSTLAGQYNSVNLPDKSIVRLNSLTSIIYDEKNWNNNRVVKLKGEAFFGVESGNKFEVQTAMGTVSVLGTQFNVKQRETFFEVTCYEGMVSVTFEKETYYLRPGDVFEVSNGNISKKLASAPEPQWFSGRSLFVKTPFSKVLQEFEWHYGVKFSTKNVDTSKLFTGNFVHSDIQNALKAILIPMRLKYKIENNHITLYKE